MTFWLGKDKEFITGIPDFVSHCIKCPGEIPGRKELYAGEFYFERL